MSPFEEILQRLTDALWGTVTPGAYGVKNAFMVYQNEWADPLVVWKDNVLNAIDVDEWLYAEYQSDLENGYTHAADYDLWLTEVGSDLADDAEYIFDAMVDSGCSKPISEYEHLAEHSLIAKERKRRMAAQAA